MTDRIPPNSPQSTDAATASPLVTFIVAPCVPSKNGIGGCGRCGGITGPLLGPLCDRTKGRIVTACWCCGEPAPIRGEGDPWEGRLDGYCDSCASTRCDTTDSTCVVKGRPKGFAAIDYRQVLVAALNGDTPSADDASRILREWDALSRVAVSAGFYREDDPRFPLEQALRQLGSVRRG